MNQEVKDVSMKYVPVPKNLRKRVTAMVDRYKSSGIMAECEEDVLDPLICNLIALMKPNGNIRLIYDARIQNHYSRKNKTFHTSLFDTLRSIDLNSSHFSIIDLTSSYYSIRLDPASRRYFCFYSDDKLCCLQALPQGYCESHNHLARVLERIFPTRKNLYCYLDDLILTHNCGWSEAMKDVIEVLSKLASWSFEMSPKRQTFSNNQSYF